MEQFYMLFNTKHSYFSAVFKLSFFSSRCAIWGSQSRSQDQPQELYCKPSNVNSPPPHLHAHVKIHRHVELCVVIGMQQRLTHTNDRAGCHGRGSAHIYSKCTVFFTSYPEAAEWLCVSASLSNTNKLRG